VSRSKSKKLDQKSNGIFLSKKDYPPHNASTMNKGIHGEAEEILMPTRICLDAALLLLLMQLYIHLILEGYSVVDVPEFIRLY
jgi:hypothetical protein